MASKVLFKYPQSCLALGRNKDSKHYWMPLPGNRLHEVVDFLMNNFVRHEMLHISSGIPKRKKAMEEYRKFLLDHLKNTAILSTVCCANNSTNDVIALSSMKLRVKDDNADDYLIQGETAEVKKVFEIERTLSKLVSVQELLTVFSEDRYFEDEGFAVHPDYRNQGLTTEVALLRRYLCEENKVFLTGGWMTSVATQKISRRDGWQTVYEIPYDTLAKKIDVTFHNPPPTFQYNVKNINDTMIQFPNK